MLIACTKTIAEIFFKEVHSKEHDERLALLEAMKELGFINRVETHYSEDGWILRGFAYGWTPRAYEYHGTWEES